MRLFKSSMGAGILLGVGIVHYLTPTATQHLCCLFLVLWVSWTAGTFSVGQCESSD